MCFCEYIWSIENFCEINELKKKNRKKNEKSNKCILRIRRANKVDWNIRQTNGTPMCIPAPRKMNNRRRLVTILEYVAFVYYCLHWLVASFTLFNFDGLCLVGAMLIYAHLCKNVYFVFIFEPMISAKLQYVRLLDLICFFNAGFLLWHCMYNVQCTQFTVDFP